MIDNLLIGCTLFFGLSVIVVVSIPCGEPGRPFNGDLTISGNQTSKGQHSPGTTVEYRCKSDAILLGQPKRQCFHRGFWDNRVPQCAQSVDIEHVLNFTLLDSHSVRSTSVRKFFDRDIKTCFSLKPSDAQTHHSLDFVLKEELPVKEIRITYRFTPRKESFDYTLWIGSKSEDKLYEIPGHKRDVSEGNEFEHHCNGIISADSLRINYGYSNQSLVQLCELTVFVIDKSGMRCGTPDVPSNGVAKTHFASGQLVVAFECHHNYNLIGTDQIRCETSGLWSGISPTCVATEGRHRAKKILKTVTRINQPKTITCSELAVDNGRIAFTDGLNIGSHAILKCNDGFKESSISESVCLWTGIWSHIDKHVFRCTEIQCHSIDENAFPAIRRVVPKKSEEFVKYSSEVEIICNNSQILERICGISGFWVKKSDINKTIGVSDVTSLCTNFQSVDSNEKNSISLNNLLIMSSIVAVTTTLLVLAILTLMRHLNKRLTQLNASVGNGQLGRRVLSSVPVNDFSLIQIKHFANNRKRYSEAKTSAYYGCDDNEVETRFSSTVAFGSPQRTAIIHTYSEPIDCQFDEQNILSDNRSENIYSEPYCTDNDIYDCDSKCFD